MRAERRAEARKAALGIFDEEEEERPRVTLSPERQAELQMRAERRAMERQAGKVLAADLTDEQVMAQVIAAGGAPNMSIEQARAITHNARIGNAIRAAEQAYMAWLAEQNQPQTGPPPKTYLTDDEWEAQHMLGASQRTLREFYEQQLAAANVNSHIQLDDFWEAARALPPASGSIPLTQGQQADAARYEAMAAAARAQALAEAAGWLNEQLSQTDGWDTAGRAAIYREYEQKKAGILAGTVAMSYGDWAKYDALASGNLGTTYPWLEEIRWDATQQAAFIDFFASANDPERNPQTAAALANLRQGASDIGSGLQAWPGVFEMLGIAWDYTVTAVREERYEDALRGAGGLVRMYASAWVESVKAEVKIAGGMAIGIIMTPVRVFTVRIPNFYRAVTERLETGERFWDVIFTGGIAATDVSGTYALAKGIGIVDKINLRFDTWIDTRLGTFATSVPDEWLPPSATNQWKDWEIFGQAETFDQAIDWAELTSSLTPGQRLSQNYQAGLQLIGEGELDDFVRFFANNSSDNIVPPDVPADLLINAFQEHLGYVPQVYIVGKPGVGKDLDLIILGGTSLSDDFLGTLDDIVVANGFLEAHVQFLSIEEAAAFRFATSQTSILHSVPNLNNPMQWRLLK